METIIDQLSVADTQLTEPPAVAGGLISEHEQQILTDKGFYWREHEGVKVLVCKPLENAGFANGFSSRVGGVSPFPQNDLNLAGFNEDAAENIYENRRRFLSAFDGDFRLATVWQIHGNTVKVIRSYEDIGESDEHADAVLSDLTGILAGAKTADCVPVLIGDPVTGAFAAIHAGWRGTVASIVQKAVARMMELYGSDPTDLIAAIGPAASVCHYEIGEDVMAAFADNFADSSKYFIPTREGHARVDLHAANRDQLAASGAADANIHTAPYCTMERPDLFFSYRLEKQKYGKTGRLLSVIGRRA